MQTFGSRLLNKLNILVSYTTFILCSLLDFFENQNEIHPKVILLGKYKYNLKQSSLMFHIQ